ncbi:hypothetical protein AKJ49_00135 [candidate division MSBL1 archaeon SCGC-AAA382A03]|uniref:Helix-turn-helix type 11 domain-containing protein n=1 Tax=candidate division MSBL1 archaeon SCGC-AAA382A03 TaxID=1698278 RepID=A0A133VH48_9EURY|nr:hypothetical protein AKJ49_00135 [candidate division MSBL1 archaeon SCGC-AAA382A03]
MGFKNREKDYSEKKHKARSRFFNENILENLCERFELSEETKHASILIFRLFLGLGKGLSSSQKRSFSGAAVWHAARILDGKTLSKEELAEELNVSSRTLARRLRELNEDEDSEIIIEYVKERLMRWNKKREEKLENLL